MLSEANEKSLKSCQTMQVEEHHLEKWGDKNVLMKL